MDVPHGLPRCIRILVHWNTTKSIEEIRHVYLGEAAVLRPDKAQLPQVDEEELEAWIEAQLLAWQNGQERKR
jgi:chorismate mutase